jgi:hypothetical protein
MDVVDEAATSELRAAMRGRRFSLRVVPDDAVVAYAGAKGKRRILLLGPADASALGVANDSLVEMLGNNPAPLRAWVRIVADATAGEVRLDAFARTVLKVGDGDRVVVRVLRTPPLPAGMAG